MQLIAHLFVLTLSLQIFCLWVCGAIDCATNQTAYTITVSQSDSANNFTNVKSAIDSIPSGNNQWIKILLDSGTYKEQIQIRPDKACIILEGRGRDTTTITFDAHSDTLESVTFSVYSDNFVAKGVTFENSYHGAQTPNVVPAVAFGSYGDKHAFYSCGFVGYQDTLWDDKGRHYFKSCYIEGAIDFIFGGGQSVYEQCAINVTGEGFITAQGRESANDPSGYVLNGCNVSGSGIADLGRPYRAFSRVIYINSIFSDVVTPQGWSIWGQQGHENDITYGEVNCMGPGADKSKRVQWEKELDSNEVAKYSTQAFINQDEWIAKQPT